MLEIEVTTTPVNLAVALNLDAFGLQLWRVQNRGPSTIYRTESATQPDTAAVRGWRHSAGSSFDLTLRGEDNPTWVWTSSNGATLVFDKPPLNA